MELPATYELSTFPPFAPPLQMSNAHIHTSSIRWEVVHVIFVFLAILFFPFIVISNMFIVATTLLIPTLHTPDNCIITALALVDFMVGAWSIPVYVLYEVQETMVFIRSNKWTCVIRYVAEEWEYFSLQMLLLLCVDRFVSVNCPFWYQRYVTTRRAVGAILVLFAEGVIEAVVVYSRLMVFDPNKLPIDQRCTYHMNFPYAYRQIYIEVKRGLQLGIALCLSVQVAVVSLKQSRKLKRGHFYFTSKQRSEFKRKMISVKITMILMFLFIILWLPTLLLGPSKILFNGRDAHTYMILIRLPVLANSFINALVYALSRKTYRQAYWFLLTTPPCKWAGLRTSLRAFNNHGLTSTSFFQKRTFQETVGRISRNPSQCAQWSDVDTREKGQNENTDDDFTPET
ncbi:adenosine receptor A3 [Aplysia californica]|uniref:Adenosine receptor A3 n=1 Tax=Aplysia californica TaxID=6500 RepID=A0ABM0KB38_APLCA|nr:adenosine receptor A3 [Aplysia californica]